MTGQVFRQDVGVVAGGDVNYHGSVIHLVRPTDERPKILQAQRNHLMELVLQVSNLRPGLPVGQIWGRVFREIEVDALDAMSSAHYAPAVAVLGRMLDEIEEAAAIQRMVARVRAHIGNDPALQNRAIDHCVIRWGKTRFLDLGMDELRELLGLFQTWQMAPAPDTAAGQEIMQLRTALEGEQAKAQRCKEHALRAEMKYQRTRARQWILTMAVSGLTVGLMLGAWQFNYRG
ncbi:hypothetical protein SAMN02745857_01794 [Andreprevotia lacus DSM 23236]|jgi:hypothetical protein|uniref:Uncharacterized protein n=1 Tax=Andreprevotia lacus DSM 23236 TaxID=1121001 RepID=A0A1W1XL77_9NEIS|nr:hypothetical protein [Andreprevotia lacus]SMC24258.1 hypothetical protein SAMN02745857_01794 [Andreprevotia lacus DSM 23236]